MRPALLENETFDMRLSFSAASSKKDEIPNEEFFRVVSQDTIFVPSGHSVVVPAIIPDWERLPIEMAAAFEPNEQFNEEKS